MFKKHLILTVLLLFVLGLAGCGSSGGSSSSSGSGSIATAFMDGGTVSVEYFNTTNNTFAAVPGASGTCADSKVTLTLPSNLSSYYPIVVSVSGATLKTSNGDKPMSSSESVSRLVKSGDSLSAIYLTVFSSIKAESWKAARLAGATAEQAAVAGDSALSSVFDSLALDGTTLTAATIESIDPTTNTAASAAALEKAQQAAMVALLGETGADDKGLSGLSTAIESIVAKPAANAAASGGEYTGSQFVSAVQSANGATPAALVQTNNAVIDAAVKSTFDSAGNATEANATEVATESAKVTVDTTKFVSVSVDTSRFQTPFSDSSDTDSSNLTAVFTKADGTTLASNFNATATGGVLLSYNGGTANATIYNENSSSPFIIRVPANTAAGTYNVSITGGDNLSTRITVEVLASGSVSVNEVELDKASGNSIIYMSGNIPNIAKIAKGATGDFGNSLEINATLAAAGSATNATNFKVKFTLPSELEFTATNSSSLEALVNTTDGTDWAKSSSDIDVTTAGVVTLASGSKGVKATKDAEFGVYSMVVDVYDTDAKLLASDTLGFYLVSNAAKGSIARITDLKYAGNATVDAGNHTSSDTVKTYSLDLAFTGTVKTWDELAGGSTAASATDLKAVLTTEPKTARGGFNAASETAVANLEVESVLTIAGGVATITPTTLTNKQLNITVGGTSSNFETINLKTYYTGSTANSPAVGSQNSVKFYSN